MTSETESMLVAANHHLEQSAWDQAAQSYLDILATSAQHLEALHGLARLAFRLEQWRESERLCLHILDLYPQHVETWLLLGSLHEAQDDLAAAVQDYEAILSFQPECVPALLHGGRCLVLRGETKTGLRYVRQATELAPHSVDAFYALGLCYHLLQMPGASLEAFLRTIEINPAFLDGYLTLADLLAENRRWSDAKKILLQAESLFPTSPLVLDKLAAVCLHLGDVDAAIAWVQRHTTLTPENLRPFLNLSTLAQLKGDWHTAQEVAQALVEYAPEHWESHYHLGSVLDVLHQPDAAKVSFRQAIALAPEQWKPYNNLAYLLNDEQNPQAWQEAADLLQQAVSLAPQEEALPRYNLVLSLINLHQQEAAREHCIQMLTHLLPHHDLFAAVQSLYAWLSEG